MQERLLSGITATGTLTIGNYIGAIKNFVKLQDKYDMYIFVADLHALTIDIDPKELRKNKNDIMALYIASGLDPQKSTLFNQSDVLAHGTMAWIMTTQTTMGELSRMTQFKDKSNKVKSDNGTEKIPTGLLVYPTLMAGDILLYKPKLVPVGADQKQHIELTRNIATRFNNKYGKTLTVPEPFIPEQGSKIMSLSDPNKKMSKSSNQPKSYISLLDDPEVAANKIRKAVTDSENNVYISEDKKGVTNLLTIYASLADTTLKDAENKLKNLNYKDFKDAVAKVVKNFLIDLQIKYKSALNDIERISQEGAIKASKVANKTLFEVENKMGLK